MSPLRIQIPLCAEDEELPSGERQAREDAAMEELEARIPGLSALRATLPTLGLRAVGGRMHLCLTLTRHPQLQLDLKDWERIPGRLIELDPSVLDQHTISQSLRATRMLLARAIRREPEAVQEIVESLKKQTHRRASKQLRRALGRDYVIQVFGEEERIQLPLLQTLAVEGEMLRFRLLVTNMRENILFRARRIELISTSGKGVDFAPAKTVVFPCARVGAASTYRSGQVLHESMELKRSVVVEGHLVKEVGAGAVVALQVMAVEREQAQ